VVDILATDVYRGGFAQEDYDLLLPLSGGKPVGLGEVGGMPTTEILHRQPRWSWFMHWGDPSVLWGERQTLRKLYKSEQIPTREDLPWVKATSPRIHYPILKWKHSDVETAGG
jgi:mannan endo-1,4-beta-mannosidase